MATTESKPIIKLHWLNGSRAQGILWLLEELQVPYELQIYHRTKEALAPPELQKIHPLGKSPVITIETPGSAAPLMVLAETGFIIQYMCDHFGQGKSLVPKRWKDGQEGQLGGETEEWMRFQYLLYYAEGSFMPYNILTLVMNNIKGPRVPFLVRPITTAVANKVSDLLILPNFKKHFAFLEGQLETSPGGGDFLCGGLTAADIAMAFALLAGRDSFGKLGKYDKGTPEATYPKLWAYMARLEAQDGWKRSIEKIKEIEGSFDIAPHRG